MKVNNPEWTKLLKKEMEKSYYQELQKFIENEYNDNKIYPHREEIFTALERTGYQQTKVVILGQDPYHGAGQAHGLSFSVKPGTTLPPSLRNIFKELHEDLGCPIPDQGHLISWADQGVLLLNTVLTVQEGMPNSHKGKGWERFTDHIINLLNKREKPVIFIMWGKQAREKLKLVTSSQHHIIQSPHPSPFAARKGFFGSKPFSKANAILDSLNEEQIDWSLS